MRPTVAVGIVHIDDYLLSVHIPMRIKRKTVGRERFSDEIIGFERRLRNFHTQNVRIKTRRQFVLIVAGNNPAAGTAAFIARGKSERGCRAHRRGNYSCNSFDFFIHDLPHLISMVSHSITNDASPIIFSVMSNNMCLLLPISRFAGIKK